MSKYLGSLIVVLLGVACGGTTDTGDQSGGGTAADGGTAAGGSSAGHNSGGSSSGTAGKAAGGSVGTDGGMGTGGGIIGTSGSVGTGGSIDRAGAGGAGGASGGAAGGPTVDPRCPAHRPAGVCPADDTGVRCEYENYTNCLCYPTPPGYYAPCQRVDQTCTATSPDPGAGGISAKIAVPPKEVCGCASGTWSCGFGP